MKYSQQVCKDGFFLGWGDVAIHANQFWHEVMVLCWDDNDEGLLPLSRRLNALTGFDFGSDQPPDLSKSSTWIIAWTRADYQKGPFQSLNHALPMFHRKQLPDDFDRLTESMMSKFDQRVKKIRMQLSLCEDEVDEDVFIKASLEDTLLTLEKKRLFFRDMIDRDLMPVDVPGDGNCCIWSIIALQAGPFVSTSVTCNKKVLEKRKEPWC